MVHFILYVAYSGIHLIKLPLVYHIFLDTGVLCDSEIIFKGSWGSEKLFQDKFKHFKLTSISLFFSFFFSHP